MEALTAAFSAGIIWAMSATNARSGLLHNEVNSRRSQRVIARIRVNVRGPLNADQVLTEVGHTLVVNAHGALISVAMPVQVNELLAIKNVITGEERHSRVIRVAAQAPAQNEVAIEFMDPSPRFWHIDFPPADWKISRE